MELFVFVKSAITLVAALIYNKVIVYVIIILLHL